MVAKDFKAQLFCLCTYITCLSIITVYLCSLVGSTCVSTKMVVSLDLVRSQKGLKIVHVNSRSVIQHFDELHSTFLDGSLDIVTFTESWLHSNCADSLIEVQGYTLHRLDRQTKTRHGAIKRGGGIVVYIREGISVVTWSDLDVSNVDIEAMSLT